MRHPIWAAMLLGCVSVLASGAAQAQAQGTGAETPEAVASEPTAEPGLGMNLAYLRDWSSAQPFLDVMKTARRWIGHKPGQWGGVSYESLMAQDLLDEQGWPKRVPGDLGSIGTVILTDLPPEAEIFAGEYLLRFKGEGIVEVSGRAQNVRYGKGEVRFEFTPGSGPVVIRIQRSDPYGKGDHLRDITVVKRENLAAYESGAVFHPAYLKVLQGLDTLRFMDWGNTNNSRLASWDERARVDDFSYTRQGVPYEVMQQLAGAVGADVWVTLPHLAEDAYARGACRLLREAVPEHGRVYVEYSNEVWNWTFDQAEWAAEQALALWGDRDQGTQFYGMRAAQVAEICAEAFGPEQREQLVNVIATQTGWLGLEKGILTAPLWRDKGPGDRPPHESFDAYAVTGYFGVLGSDKRRDMVRQWIEDSAEAARAAGAAAGLGGEALEAHVARHRYDLAVSLATDELLSGALSGDVEGSLNDLRDRVFPYHAEIARDYDLDLIMYEGGTHVVGIGAGVDDPELTAFFTHLNYTAEMGMLYARLIADWRAAGGGLFTHFNEIQKPGKWGSWGALRYLGDDTARWQVLEAAK
ncbi:hypothetical protein [Roseovarius nubinhibens]